MNAIFVIGNYVVEQLNHKYLFFSFPFYVMCSLNFIQRCLKVTFPFLTQWFILYFFNPWDRSENLWNETKKLFLKTLQLSRKNMNAFEISIYNSMILLFDENFFSANHFFRIRNIKKSDGAKSNEYGTCLINCNSDGTRLFLC